MCFRAAPSIASWKRRLHTALSRATTISRSGQAITRRGARLRRLCTLLLPLLDGESTKHKSRTLKSGSCVLFFWSMLRICPRQLFFHQLPPQILAYPALGQGLAELDARGHFERGQALGAEA